MSGWSSLLMAFASVQVPMWAGLARGRAGPDKYLMSPFVALPLTALAGIGMACLAPLLSRVGIAPHGMLHFAVGTAWSALVGYSGGRAAAEEPGRSKTHERGTVVEDKDWHRVRAVKADPHQGRIAVGGRFIEMSDEAKHFKLIGTTGTGKSTAIQEILTSAIGRGDRAVIADPDGGYLDRFYDPARGDIVLNPFDARSVKWDLFGEIKNSYDVDQLARSLIPDHDGSTVVALSLSVPSSSVAFRPKRQRVAVLQPRAPNTDTTLCSRTSPFAATSSCAGAPQVRAGASWH